MEDKDEKYWKITDNAQVIINPNSSSSQTVDRLGKKELRRRGDESRRRDNKKHD